MFPDKVQFQTYVVLCTICLQQKVSKDLLKFSPKFIEKWNPTCFSISLCHHHRHNRKKPLAHRSVPLTLLTPTFPKRKHWESHTKRIKWNSHININFLINGQKNSWLVEWAAKSSVLLVKWRPISNIINIHNNRTKYKVQTQFCNCITLSKCPPTLRQSRRELSMQKNMDYMRHTKSHC